MRILIVSPRAILPSIPGSGVRVSSIARCLSRSNDVRVFCQVAWRGLRGYPWIEELRPQESLTVYEYFHPAACGTVNLTEHNWVNSPILAGSALQITRPKILDDLVRWSNVILVEFPWQFDYIYRRRSGRPVVLASHNFEHDKFADYARAQGVPVESNRWLQRIEKMERDAVARAALVAAVSPEDRRRFIDKYGAGPERVVNVPNGADVERYVPADSVEKRLGKRELNLPERPTVLFVGGPSPPNRVGAQWLQRLAKRTRRFSFLVVGLVGRYVRPTEHLLAVGHVEDYCPYQRAADFGICPIEYGGGTKIKLLESLSAGLPTVAFAASLHGTRYREGEHLLVADPNEDALLGALDRLAADPELANRLGRAGREFTVEHYAWRDISTKLETALQRVVAAR